MSDAPLHPLPVILAKPAAAGQLVLLLRAAGTPVAAEYAHAGQYALVKLGDDVARPFAIASPPRAEPLELLLKLPPDRAAFVSALTDADRVPVGAPRGPGFPVARAHGRPVWLIGTGSGVAPLRAAVEEIVARRADFADVHLLYGVRRVDELAYTDRFDAWRAAGVDVVPVVSRPDAAAWTGVVGRVQDHLPPSFARPGDAWFFLAGLPEMDREVHAALLARGVSHEQIFRNY
jgi:NAD(P)H-flavin reductase